MSEEKQLTTSPTRYEVMKEIEVTDEGVVLRTLAQIKTWAGEIASSGMAPKGMDSEQKVMLAVQTGMELGFTPMRSLQAVVIVNGRATLMGEAALGLIRASGRLAEGTQPMLGCRVTTEAEKLAGEGDLIGYCRTKRAGQEWVETLFSQGDAKKAALWDKVGPWKSYPKRMLPWRAVGFHMRDYWSDVGNGLMLADEAMDMRAPAPPPRDVTPEAHIVTGSADPLLQGLTGDPAEPDAPKDIEDAEFVEGTFVAPTRSVTREELAEEFPEDRPDWQDADGNEIDPETGEVLPPEEGGE